jgi:hypothetical protein
LVDTGLIAGKVYLSAAAQGLGTWFHNRNKTGLAQPLALQAQAMQLSDNTVLITGGATGIGYAMAEAFLEGGWKHGRRLRPHRAEAAGVP